MQRDEAQARVGQTVVARTEANGTYLGVLEAVMVRPRRPWRARVRVLGVVAPALHFERNGVVRRGFRPGETLEVGGLSVKMAAGNEPVEDYLTVLKRKQAESQQRLDARPDGEHAWVWHGFAHAERCAIEAEETRLRTGTWTLSGSVPVYVPPGAPESRLRP